MVFIIVNLQRIYNRHITKIQSIIKKIFTISIVLFVFGNVMSFLVNNVNDLQGILKTSVKFYRYVFGSVRIFTGIFYISSGIIITKTKISVVTLGTLAIMLMGIIYYLFAHSLLSSLSIAIYAVTFFFVVPGFNR
jgi:hypothetical protein